MLATRHLEDLTDRVKPRTASNLLLWVIVGFVTIFFGWAALAELDRTVRASGKVIASSQLQVVSNLEGGVLEAILVQPGQLVQRGAELLRLDQTQTQAELGSSEAAFSSLNVKIARLHAEVAGREPVYPAAKDPATAEQIQIERSLHSSRMADLNNLVAASQARVLQAHRAVAEAESAYQARLITRNARRAEVNLITPLVDRGIEPRLSLIQAESSADIAASEVAAAAAAVARARAAVAEAQAMLGRARQDWRAQAAAELATAQAEIGARRRALPALADRVDRTVIRAPLPGRVNRVLANTIGGTVRPGEPLVEIVPSADSLLIEARVTPQDIAFVRLDQEARVGITAYDQAIYGTLVGRVVYISPDAVYDEQAQQSFYLVRVRTVKNALRNSKGKRLPIGPGMMADVSFLGDKRTVLQYLLTPMTKLSETALREQ